MKISKERRQLYIKKILAEHDVETQEQLVELLNQNGLEVTQATISRDIRELNLVKTPAANGKTKYTFIIDTPNQGNDLQLRKKMEEVLLKIEQIDYLILLKTLPANAHVLGALIDSLDFDGLAGTVCGNDTCLLVARSPEEAAALVEQFTSYIP